MIEYEKVIVWLFVMILLFYMIYLAYFTRKKWEFRTYTFFVLILGLSLLTIGTFTDMMADTINYKYSHIVIEGCFTLGVIIYIIGVILWSNYTKKMIEKFEEVSLTDHMTGALNRKGIDRVYNWIAQLDNSFFVIVCDLDETKKINDKYGHLQGDIYIKSAAKVITSTVGLRGYLGRTGGDEFVVIFKCEDIEHLQQIILTIKKSVHEIFTEQNTGISIGYSVFPDDGDTFQELVKVADERMYEDKKNGKIRMAK